MIRVTVRFNSEDAVGRILKFDEEIDLNTLMRIIANKLDVNVDGIEDNVASKYALLLNGKKAIVDDPKDIYPDDDLILAHLGEDGGDDEPQPSAGSSQDNATATASSVIAPANAGNRRSRLLSSAWRWITSVAKQEPNQTSQDNENPESTSVVKKEPNQNSQDEDEFPDSDNDSVVEDVTEEATKLKNKIKVPQDVISLDSDEDDELDKNDDEDGSVVDGLGASEDEEDEEDEEEEEESDDSDWEVVTSKPQKLKQGSLKKENPPPESPLQVFMDEKDVPAAPGKPAEHGTPEATCGLEEISTLVDKAGRTKADQAVKDRIIKLLNTGFHDQSNEQEAKNAMKLAQRLMQKHNLAQAVLLKEFEEKKKIDQTGGCSDEILKGGMVRVRIVNRNTGKPALYERWIANLTYPVTKNFGVKSYYQVKRGAKCTVTFYGIYTSAQLAAYAFKVATERIAQMSKAYIPENQKNKRGARLSYSLGIVRGISEDVEKTIKMAEEKRLHKLEQARLSKSKGEAYEESDGEDDGMSMELDGGDNDDPGPSPSDPVAAATTSSSKWSDDCSRRQDNSDDGKQDDNDEPHTTSATKPKEKSGEELDSFIRELEKESSAAIVLVDHTEKVAEEVLKENGIKLSKGSKRKSLASFDQQSFRKGIEDSAEIDISQRALKDEVKVKAEVKKEKKVKKEAKQDAKSKKARR